MVEGVEQVSGHTVTLQNVKARMHGLLSIVTFARGTNAISTLPLLVIRSNFLAVFYKSIVTIK
jgi:hypothetical protein